MTDSSSSSRRPSSDIPALCRVCGSFNFMRLHHATIVRSIKWYANALAQKASWLVLFLNFHDCLVPSLQHRTVSLLHNTAASIQPPTTVSYLSNLTTTPFVSQLSLPSYDLTTPLLSFILSIARTFYVLMASETPPGGSTGYHRVPRTSSTGNPTSIALNIKQLD